MLETIKPAFPFLITFIGAFMLYILGRNKGGTTWSVLSALNISVGKRASPHIIFIDGLVTSLLAALVAYIITEPQTNAHAMAAGLSSTGIINSLAQNDAN